MLLSHCQCVFLLLIWYISSINLCRGFTTCPVLSRLGYGREQPRENPKSIYGGQKTSKQMTKRPTSRCGGHAENTKKAAKGRLSRQLGQTAGRTWACTLGGQGGQRCRPEGNRCKGLQWGRCRMRLGPGEASGCCNEWEGKRERKICGEGLICKKKTELAVKKFPVPGHGGCPLWVPGVVHHTEWERGQAEWSESYGRG